MSTASQYHYETVYVVRPTISDKDLGTINDKIDSVISRFEGKLEVRDDWGTKEMAYKIDGFSTGRYGVIVYTGKGGVVEEIERHFKISEDVIRFLSVSVDSKYEYSQVRKQIDTQQEEDQNREKSARRRSRESN